MCFAVFQYFDNRAEAHNFLKILGARQLKFLGIKANNQPFLTSESSTHAPANCSSSTDACHRRHEREKRRAYEQRVLEVEHGAFTPLVLSTSGGWAHLLRLHSRDSQVSSSRNMTNHTAAH